MFIAKFFRLKNDRESESSQQCLYVGLKIDPKSKWKTFSIVCWLFSYVWGSRWKNSKWIQKILGNPFLLRLLSAILLSNPYLGGKDQVTCHRDHLTGSPGSVLGFSEHAKRWPELWVGSWPSLAQQLAVEILILLNRASIESNPDQLAPKGSILTPIRLGVTYIRNEAI